MLSSPKALGPYTYQTFVLYFFLKFFVLHLSLWSILKNVCMKCETWIKVNFSCQWISTVSNTICWKDYPSSIEFIWPFARKGQLGIFVWIYLWVLCSFPLNCVFIPAPVPNNLNDSSLKSDWPIVLTSYFCKILKIIPVSLPIHINFRMILPVFVF